MKLPEYKKWGLVAIFLFVLTTDIYSQSGSDRSSPLLGIYYMTGNSAGINYKSSTLNNQIPDNRYGMIQLGMYIFLPIAADSSQRMLKYLKMDVAYCSRGGAFELNNGTGGIAKMTSNSIDLTPMLPFRFPVAK